MKKKTGKKYNTKIIVAYVVFVVLLTTFMSLVVLNINMNSKTSGIGAVVTGFAVAQIDNINTGVKNIDIEKGYFFPVGSVLGVLVCIAGITLIARKK